MKKLTGFYGSLGKNKLNVLFSCFSDNPHSIKQMQVQSYYCAMDFDEMFAFSIYVVLLSLFLIHSACPIP